MPSVYPFRLLAIILVTLSVVANAEVKPTVADGIAWYDVSKWDVEGRGWAPSEFASFYDRLPAKAEGKVRGAVWNLSRHSAGLNAQFKTDATSIHVRYRLRSASLSMSHMPATGVSGVDLYAQDKSKRWRWVAVSRPNKQDFKQTLIKGLAPGVRSYMLYLPLYNGLTKLEIGVPTSAKFTPVKPRTSKPILFYGTSITHGACASRPGMPHPAILGRRLNMPVINLGFSGNGRMESEVGALLSEIDPAVYVIDCLPNMNAQTVTQRAAPLVRQLRKARPNTPIILVEDRAFTNTWIRPDRQNFHTANRAALKKAFETLKGEGVTKLYYLKGDDLLGDDSDGATDGSHPSDLGFFRQANVMEPIIRKALGKN